MSWAQYSCGFQGLGWTLSLHQQIRSNKLCRHLIIVTPNPNIVVDGGLSGAISVWKRVV